MERAKEIVIMCTTQYKLMSNCLNNPKMIWGGVGGGVKGGTLREATLPKKKTKQKRGA